MNSKQHIQSSQATLSIPHQIEQLEEDEDDEEGQYYNESKENSSDQNYINLCSENNIDAFQDKLIKKNQRYGIIPINPKNNQQINLWTGLFITDDGILRYTTSLDAICLGSHQQYVEKVEEIKKLNVIDIKFEPKGQFKKNSIQEAINFVKYSNSIQFNQISCTLEKMRAILNNMYSYLNKDISKQLLIEKDYEFQKFNELCFLYIENYISQNPNSMFLYTIERLNLFIKEPEITRTGYSKSFLELIGLDSISLVQLIQRNKQVDLIKNKLDISIQAIHCLSDFEKNYYPTSQVISHITTFDGFPIKLYQTYNTVKHGFKSQLVYGQECEYSFTFTEIDVDFYDLQQLIQYRQRIINNDKNQNIDDFIRKELSYLFEDVEYSVHSQDFINKFYNSNIQQLKEFREQKHVYNNACKYKQISQ